MTIRELSILKAALEGDIQRQEKSPNAHRKDFKKWLDDSKKLLRKVTLKLSEEEAKRFLKKTE
ncbi:hypothetical protein ACUXCC_004573 [Cytobacillus horneckiae]|uniref:Uncharacterized protein n=1 Tax=Cytobacillus horneckiae TaxID=549687 RepID=A0A2N0ZD44_9BACI|nr:hypothetical protein [Cytobacillus horneckiae]MBN6887301.1 hypothetical protein [Cytobacillus horneckiae]MCM3178108.1 hypothetical protein [Cytobacillus horneckiae]MEC1157154.1 hypothetical protein [Cytobacillus horneckiae]MED2938087.1 hypothetical protein [Cytobacillus horneckiae]PKG27431.1 hypothetical protein CWS20_18750 [Cytobacillus horneckiae]